MSAPPRVWTLRQHNLPGSRARRRPVAARRQVAAERRGADVNIWMEGKWIGGDAEALDPNRELKMHTTADVLAKTAAQAFPDTKVGGWGAGPATMLAGWNSLWLLGDEHRDEPDVELWVGAAHLAPSMRRGLPAEGHPSYRAAKANRDKRIDLGRLEIANIIELSEDLDRVAWGADWNLGPRDPFVRPLLAAGFSIVDVGPTCDGRAIDWWAVRGVTVLRKRRTPRGISDHYGTEVVVV